MSDFKDLRRVRAVLKAIWADDEFRGKRNAQREYAGTPCVYCGRHPTTFDHVIPRSRGGSEHLRNLVPACLTCNRSKRSAEPAAYFRAHPEAAAFFLRFAVHADASIRLDAALVAHRELPQPACGIPSTTQPDVPIASGEQTGASLATSVTA